MLGQAGRTRKGKISPPAGRRRRPPLSGPSIHCLPGPIGRIKMEAEAEAAGRRVVQPDTRAKASKEILHWEEKKRRLRGVVQGI